MKKKTTKKPAKKKAAPRKVPTGARDVGYRERKLKNAVVEARPLVVDDGDGGTAPVLCCESGCFAHAVEWADDEAYCQKHLDELTAALEALTGMFRALSEQQDRVAAAVERCIDVLAEPPARREPERHVYVSPPPGPRPELPVLQPHLLEFHTTRQGLLCDMAFAIFADVVIMRVHDRLSGGSTYSLAGVADLYTEQYGGEVASHYWHRATDEEHAAIAACDPEEPPAASERLSA